MILSSVGQQNAYEAVLKVYNGIKDDARVKALGVKEVLDKSKAAYDSLAKYTETCSEWKIQDYKKRTRPRRGIDEGVQGLVPTAVGLQRLFAAGEKRVSTANLSTRRKMSK